MWGLGFGGVCTVSIVTISDTVRSLVLVCKRVLSMQYAEHDMCNSSLSVQASKRQVHDEGHVLPSHASTTISQSLRTYMQVCSVHLTDP